MLQHILIALQRQTYHRKNTEKNESILFACVVLTTLRFLKVLPVIRPLAKWLRSLNSGSAKPEHCSLGTWLRFWEVRPLDHNRCTIQSWYRAGQGLGSWPCLVLCSVTFKLRLSNYNLKSTTDENVPVYPFAMTDMSLCHDRNVSWRHDHVLSCITAYLPYY